MEHPVIHHRRQSATYRRLKFLTLPLLSESYGSLYVGEHQWICCANNVVACITGDYTHYHVKKGRYRLKEVQKTQIKLYQCGFEEEPPDKVEKLMYEVMEGVDWRVSFDLSVIIRKRKACLYEVLHEVSKKMPSGYFPDYKLAEEMLKYVPTGEASFSLNSEYGDLPYIFESVSYMYIAKPLEREGGPIKTERIWTGESETIV